MEEKDTLKEKEIRHTINAEETFTLAKDIFDIRTFVKSVYANRAVIARRLNILSLVFSVAFTAIYIAYAIFSGLFKKLSLGWDIALYCVLGVYAVLVVTLIIFTVRASSANTKTVKRYNKILKAFRYSIKVVSLVMAITGLIMSSSRGDSAPILVAVDTVFLIISIVCTIVQAVPLIFGGLGGVARWLLSPVKRRVPFAEVVLEWYGLVISGQGQSKSVKKVAQQYFDDIGEIIDAYLIPQIGKKKITAISVNQILTVISSATEEEIPLVEGTFKSVFKYAEECGYIATNPCRDLNLEGSIEVIEKKKRPTIKDKIADVGKKVGVSILNKYLSPKDED